MFYESFRTVFKIVYRPFYRLFDDTKMFLQIDQNGNQRLL